MKREEAIAVLRKLPVGLMDLSNEQKSDLTEAIDMALAALRSPTREQVEKWRSKWIYSRTTTINHLAVVQCSNPKCGHEAFAYMQYGNFCPYCGAPMTDEAVEITLQRLEALKDG